MSSAHAAKFSDQGHHFERAMLKPSAKGRDVGGHDDDELQAKAEKYESKAAQCREWAEKAKEGPQRILHEVLADYYVGLATDFRNVIAKKQKMPA